MSAVEALKKIIGFCKNNKQFYFVQRINQIATAAIKEAEFTVEIIVPEPYKDGGSCSIDCPLWDHTRCRKGWSIDHKCCLMTPSLPMILQNPGPGCPRGRREE